MKKIKLIAMGLITAMCLSSMVACGDTSDSTTSNSSNQSSSSNESSNSNTSSDKKIYTQDVKVINNTGVEIKEMYVSASEKNDWEEDILGQDTFASGTQLDIKFKEEEKAQYWDLMVKDSEGTSITWTNMDLFSISEITLNFDSATGEATASYK